MLTTLTFLYIQDRCCIYVTAEDMTRGQTGRGYEWGTYQKTAPSMRTGLPMICFRFDYRTTNTFLLYILSAV